MWVVMVEFVGVFDEWMETCGEGERERERERKGSENKERKRVIYCVY